MINFIHIPKNGGTSIRLLCDNKTLKYNPHKADVFDKNITNQLVIIRNPIERFVSAVNYGLEKWSHEPQIKFLIDNKIDSAEEWIQIWKNPSHKYYSNLMDEMKNKTQRIGNNLPEYKYTYCPQSIWINNPKYICIMDSLENDFEYFQTTILKQDRKKSLTKTNFTTKKNNDLSEDSINFLKKIYNDDFILYNKYKNIDVKLRIPFD